jgi:hypothetical protein
MFSAIRELNSAMQELSNNTIRDNVGANESLMDQGLWKGIQDCNLVVAR